MDPILDQLAPHLQGQYQVERELGRGGMGVVYLAREVRLDRLVALKVLPPHLAADPTIRERFLREARTAAQLSHPNIVPIYRAEEIGGFAFFAMAYIDGENLAERVRDRGVLPPAEVVRVLRESAWALAYAHARGVVHRDIKAANIMIERGTGRAVVTDFGIARDKSSSSLTSPGEVIGTAYFMSPEQANGSEFDGRTDLYSLGVAGFQALSGRLPFEGDNPTAVLVAVATRPAPSLREFAPSLPPALIEVIDRCLQRDPNLRYPTGEDLAAALGQAIGDATAAAALDSASLDRIIPEAQAEAIWLRAAQLQAEAASRLEQRSRQGNALNTLSHALPSGGYRLRDVELAAKEVGISPEFVALALAEGPATRSVAVVQSSERSEKMTTALLGTDERSISVSRVIKASPKIVMEALGQVFPARPYFMKFKETVGGHPIDGGVLVFAIPSLMATDMGLGGSSYSSFTYRMYQIELKQLNVTLRPVQGTTPSTEVTLYGDLRPGMVKNIKADGWIAGAVGAMGAGGGFTAGLQLLGGALAALPALGAAVVLTGASLGWYRWLYRRCLRKSVEELEGLLTSIESQLQSRELFGASVGNILAAPKT